MRTDTYTQKCSGDRQIFKSLTKSHQLSVNQSLQTADFFPFFLLLRGCTHTGSTHHSTRTLYSSHDLRREKFSHGALSFLTEGEQKKKKVLVAAKKTKITKQSNECVSFTPAALETSVGFASLVTGNISNRKRVRMDVGKK